MPKADTWGLLVRDDSLLAKSSSIKPEDLPSLPLLVSSQERLEQIEASLGTKNTKFNVVATYILLYNASLLVKAGIGAALCVDGIINTSGTDLTFVPLEESDPVRLTLAWKKYERLSLSAEVFLSKLRA